jgi:hypothetical protein
MTGKRRLGAVLRQIQLLDIFGPLEMFECCPTCMRSHVGEGARHASTWVLGGIERTFANCSQLDVLLVQVASARSR